MPCSKGRPQSHTRAFVVQCQCLFVETPERFRVFIRCHVNYALTHMMQQSYGITPDHRYDSSIGVCTKDIDLPDKSRHPRLPLRDIDPTINLIVVLPPLLHTPIPAAFLHIKVATVKYATATTVLAGCVCIQLFAIRSSVEHRCFTNVGRNKTKVTNSVSVM